MIGCSYIQLLPIDVSRAAKPVSVADSDVRSGSRRCPLGKEYRGKSATTYVIRVCENTPRPGGVGKHLISCVSDRSPKGEDRLRAEFTRARFPVLGEDAQTLMQ